jgi:hypothetical protein
VNVGIGQLGTPMYRMSRNSSLSEPYRQIRSVHKQLQKGESGRVNH